MTQPKGLFSHDEVDAMFPRCWTLHVACWSTDHLKQLPFTERESRITNWTQARSQVASVITDEHTPHFVHTIHHPTSNVQHPRVHHTYSSFHSLLCVLCPTLTHSDIQPSAIVRHSSGHAATVDNISPSITTRRSEFLVLLLLHLILPLLLLASWLSPGTLCFAFISSPAQGKGTHGDDSPVALAGI